jgi:hypothetical protein
MPQPETVLLQTEAPRSNGGSTLHDLFALTDEQILEIEPAAQDVEIRGEESTAGDRAAQSATPNADTSATAARATQNARDENAATTIAPGAKSLEGAKNGNAAEPPAWLAAQMKDPWNGETAREFWDGVQQSQQESAAYREVFAKPEEARAAAERARVLDDIDRAYFGAQGSGPEQARASREQLAAMMMREDPAAFREMVFEGLRALEQSGKSVDGKSVAQAFRPESVSAAEASARTEHRNLTPQGASSSAESAARSAHTASANEAQVSAYAAFEKAANEDLEKSVGGAIERMLQQALPNGGRAENAPLTGRLTATIRQDIEKALQGDRQLGEQVAQVLAGRRLDAETRAQVVRLINDRAQQLVPGAAKRVLSDWTNTTLAAHRGKTARADAASSIREVASSASVPVDPRSPKTLEAVRPVRGTGKAGRFDYGKLSDEQILDL